MDRLAHVIIALCDYNRCDYNRRSYASLCEDTNNNDTSWDGIIVKSRRKLTTLESVDRHQFVRGQKYIKTVSSLCSFYEDLTTPTNIQGRWRSAVMHETDHCAKRRSSENAEPI